MIIHGVTAFVLAFTVQLAHVCTRNRISVVLISFTAVTVATRFMASYDIL